MNKTIWENDHGFFMLTDSPPLGLRIEVGDDALFGFNANVRVKSLADVRALALALLTAVEEEAGQ